MCFLLPPVDSLLDFFGHGTIEALEALHRHGAPICFLVTKNMSRKAQAQQITAELLGERALGQHNLAHEPLTRPDLFSCTVIFARARRCGCAF